MNFFSYESKPMQILTFLGDLIFLNFAYLFCCIPIFTIGAAQAGLYTAMKVLTDPEDDSSAMAAFFKGFRTGFGKVTLAWGILTLAVAVVAAAGLTAIAYGAAPWIIAVAVCLVALFQSLVPLFHARFDCTVIQLIRNTWFLVIGHPLRSIALAAMIWLPVIVFLLDAVLFMELTPIWGALYFSTACLFGFTFMKKPFNTLIQHFNETHAAQETAQPQASEPEIEAPEGEVSEDATEEAEKTEETPVE